MVGYGESFGFVGDTAVKIFERTRMRETTKKTNIYIKEEEEEEEEEEDTQLSNKAC